MDIYQAAILDHYKNPHYRQDLPKATNHGSVSNPLCGDAVTMSLKVEEGKITEVGWQGEGCVLTQATASMLSDYLIGKDVSLVKNLNQEDIIKLLGIAPGPNRLECALLPLKAAKTALA